MKHDRWSLAMILAALVGLAACASTKKQENRLLAELADLDKQTIFSRAEALYGEKKYSDARELFSFLYDTFPNDPLGHKAALRIADTYALKKDSTSQTEARLRYRDFANRYPNDPDRDYALLHLGHTYTAGKLRPDRDLTPLRDALDAYQQLVNLYPSSPLAGEAREKLRSLREALAEHDWLVAEFYLRNRRLRGALWRLEKIKQEFTDYSRMAQVEELISQVQAQIDQIEARTLRHEPPAEKPEQALTRTASVG